MQAISPTEPVTYRPVGALQPGDVIATSGYVVASVVSTGSSVKVFWAVGPIAAFTYPSATQLPARRPGPDQ